jgi:hypothetical protein
LLLGEHVQKRNRTSWCLELHASVSQLFDTKRTHSRVSGLKGEALFFKLIFLVCLPIVDKYEFVCWYQNAQIPITGNGYASTCIGISTHTGIFFGSITRRVEELLLKHEDYKLVLTIVSVENLHIH